jgi:hypothetical protein
MGLFAGFFEQLLLLAMSVKALIIRLRVNRSCEVVYRRPTRQQADQNPDRRLLSRYPAGRTRPQVDTHPPALQSRRRSGSASGSARPDEGQRSSPVQRTRRNDHDVDAWLTSSETNRVPRGTTTRRALPQASDGSRPEVIRIAHPECWPPTGGPFPARQHDPDRSG